jgi:hypothetical protein
MRVQTMRIATLVADYGISIAALRWIVGAHAEFMRSALPPKLSSSRMRRRLLLWSLAIKVRGGEAGRCPIDKNLPALEYCI